MNKTRCQACFVIVGMWQCRNCLLSNYANTNICIACFNKLCREAVTFRSIDYALSKYYRLHNLGKYYNNNHIGKIELWCFENTKREYMIGAYLGSIAYDLKLNLFVLINCYRHALYYDQYNNKKTNYDYHINKQPPINEISQFYDEHYWHNDLYSCSSIIKCKALKIRPGFYYMN